MATKTTAARKTTKTAATKKAAPKASRHDLALAIAGDHFSVVSRPSHERLEDATGKQRGYVQGKALIVPTGSITSPAIAKLVTARGYGRSTITLTPENLAAAKKVVAHLAR